MNDVGSESLTTRQLYRRLAAEGEVDEDDLDETVERVHRVTGASSESWYLRAFAFVGAWISAVFAFVVLVAGAKWLDIPEDLIEYWPSWVVFGGMFLGVAHWIGERGEESVFFSQVAAVVAGTGLGLVVGGGYVGAEELFRNSDWVAQLGIALGCFGGAVVTYARREERSFYGQLALFASAFGYWVALVAADEGYAALFDGAAYNRDTWTLMFVVCAAISTVLYRYHNSAIHRFITTLAVFPLALRAILERMDAGTLEGAQAAVPFLGLLFAVATVCVVLAFYPLERLSLSTQFSLRPLGWAAALSMAGLSSSALATAAPELDASWVHTSITLAALIYLLWRVTEATETWRIEPIVLGVGVVLVLGVVAPPGILVGLLFLAVGLWRQQGRFLALGSVTLGYHIVEFYYLMDISFFDKSMMLMATGAVLLAVRLWCVRRSWFGGRALS